MAQSLRFREGVNITQEDVQKWTEKLSHVLDTSPAGHKYRIYLELKQWKSEQSLLDIWEMCNTFVIKTKKQPPHTGLEQKYLELEALYENFFSLFTKVWVPNFV
jgi:hypothetical protein